MKVDWSNCNMTMTTMMQLVSSTMIDSFARISFLVVVRSTVLLHHCRHRRLLAAAAPASSSALPPWISLTTYSSCW
jgi:hypothetical protein